MKKADIIPPTEAEDREITRAAETDSDNPPLTAEDFRSMRSVGRPTGSNKTRKTVYIDNDVIAELEKGGRGWSTRMNSLLREALHLDD